MVTTLRAVSCLAIATAIVGFVDSARAQQGAPTTLPDVSVTAPRNPNEVHPSSEGAIGTPYAGNTRVEEAKWPVIPCTTSRVASGDTNASCRRGPVVMNFEHGDAQNMRLPSNCQIAHDLVISKLGGLDFEADSLIFDPYYISGLGHQRQDCYVEAIPRSIQAQLVDMNHVTRQASGWGAMQQTADLTYMEFTVGPSRCLAWESRGPRWGGGFIWLAHVAACRNDGQPVSLADVASVMGTLKLESHDSNGNLH
ncbi:MAG TPA: hypothetical protein VNV38_21285 [Stellaceae bacterium]|jgi:hypothetical protein|nr:hypothetical protein [Stellaceae bacterium]